MFKRTNKIASLLVVAASVTSMVPAYADDVKRIESKDGQVYNAQAYKDGTAVIDGDVKDDDNDEVYYLKDGKYTKLDDIDSGDDFDGITAEKYLDTDDGDNYVDLTTGKVTDDDIKSDNADDAAADLKKKVKSDNDGRYLKDSNDYGYGSDETPDLTKDDILTGNQYGETWYGTQYAAKKTTEAGVNVYNVFTDENGKYIDADYNIGKIKVTTDEGSVSLKNTDTDEITDEDDTKATVVDTTSGAVIAQDKDYIYRIATIKVTCTSGDITEINGVEVSTSSEVFTSVDNGYKFKAIQKISKSQDSDDIDGIKYSSKVDTYIISEDDGSELDSDKKNLLLGDDTKFTVSNGKLIAYSNDTDSPLAATITLKSKSAYYYTDVADTNDDDVDDEQVDVDGNLWRLDDGYVYKWDNDEDWDKVYKVDGAMSHLSIYDKDNLVVWSDDDDDDKVFSVIGSKAKEETPPITTTTQVGWVQNTTDGSYTYYKEDGTQVKNDWVQSSTSGLWYFMNTDGIMLQNGWLQNGGAWYYLSETGAMKTGWIQLSGIWYYLSPVSGGPLGAMKTGWFQDTTGTWYYANESGAMLHDTTVGGYTLGSSGAWIQ